MPLTTDPKVHQYAGFPNLNGKIARANQRQVHRHCRCAAGRPRFRPDWTWDWLETGRLKSAWLRSSSQCRHATNSSRTPSPPNNLWPSRKMTGRAIVLVTAACHSIRFIKRRFTGFLSFAIFGAARFEGFFVTIGVFGSSHGTRPPNELLSLRAFLAEAPRCYGGRHGVNEPQLKAMFETLAEVLGD